jgi:hypothetical protein
MRGVGGMRVKHTVKAVSPVALAVSVRVATSRSGFVLPLGAGPGAWFTVAAPKSKKIQRKFFVAYLDINFLF